MTSRFIRPPVHVWRSVIALYGCSIVGMGAEELAFFLISEAREFAGLSPS
jgi:hypothetical protein